MKRNAFLLGLICFLLVAAYKINFPTLSIGEGTDEDITITARNGDANEPAIKYDSATDVWQFSNDGTTFNDMGSGGGGGGINLLIDSNWDFEKGILNWTDAGLSTLTAETTEVGFGSGSGKIVATGAGTVTSSAITIPKGLYGKLCVLEINYKGADANVDFYAWDGSAVIDESTKALVTASGWVTSSTTFICPSSGTVAARFESSTANTTYIDNIHLGVKDIITAIDPRWPSYDESEVTFSSTPSGFTNQVARLLPYQATDGSWRLIFNIYFEFTAATVSSLSITIDGITTISENQAISGLLGGSTGNVTSTKGSASIASSGQLTWVGTSSGTTTTGQFSGDIALASKPTWATKTAPDIYLAGMPSQVDGSWKSCTVTGSWVSNTTYTCLKKQVGEDMKYQVKATLTGAPTSTALTIDLPSGDVIDTAKIINPVSGQFDLGYGQVRSGSEWPLRVKYVDTNTVSAYYFAQFGAGSTDPVRAQPLTETAPATLASGNTVTLIFSVPLEGLSWYEWIAAWITGFNTAQDGKAGLIEYNYEELDISSVGSFSASQPVLRLARVGSVCTLEWESLGHTSLNNPDTGAGFIPTECLPPHTVRSISYQDSDEFQMITILTSGLFRVNYRDYTGGAPTRTSTGEGAMSWVVDE